MNPPASWMYSATATNGTATTDEVVRVANQRHMITHVSATAGGTGTQQAGGYSVRLVTRSLTETAAVVDDVGNTTTSFITTLASAVDDHYNGLLLRFISGNLSGQTKAISDYVGATLTVTTDAFSETPDPNSAFEILTDAVFMQWHAVVTAPIMCNFGSPIQAPVNTAIYGDIAGTGANIIARINIAGLTL